jgi:polyferredoxin
MKRENFRRTIITISAFLMPFTMFFISPVVILMAAAEGIINSSAAVFIVLFIASLFIGRFWCGWLCPSGGMQDALGSGSRKKPSGGWKDYIKFAFFVPWVGLIVWSFIAAGGISAANLLYGTEEGIYPEILYVYLIVLIAIVVFTFALGKRSICRYICPMAVIMIIGRKIGSALHLPGLRLSAEPENCVECGRCDSACNMGIPVSAMVKENKTENRECILCGACVDACKKDAIKIGFGRR